MSMLQLLSVVGFVVTFSALREQGALICSALLRNSREELSELRGRLDHVEGPAVMQLEEELSRLQVGVGRCCGCCCC